MSTVVIVKKSRRFVPVELDIAKGQVRAALSKHGARRAGSTIAYVGGVGSAAIRNLLTHDVETYDSIRALKEAFSGEAVTFHRIAEHDR